MSDEPIIPETSKGLEERLALASPRLKTHLNRSSGRIRGAEIDDVAQEVFARALRYRHSFDEQRALWPWLRRVADHVLLDFGARGSRIPDSFDGLVPDAQGCHQAVDARDELRRILSILSETEREVLLLFHNEGESVQEIAADLGMPVGTVKSHLSRARRKLGEIETQGDKS